MKKLFTHFLILLPGFLMAQKYEIPISDVQKEFKDINTNTINTSIQGWEVNAKLIFTGLNDRNADSIRITNHGTLTNVDPEPYVKDGLKVFIIADRIKANIYAFDIYYHDKLKGKIIFNLQSDPDKKTGNKDNDMPVDQIQGYIGALTSANFIGNNKFLANLTPIVNLGGIVPLISNGKSSHFSWDLDVNPYIGGGIDSKDSISFIPALMLPGKAGLILNNYLNFDIGKTRITLMPFGFGLKFISNLKDSSKTVIQNNMRFGMSLKYADAFVLSGQYTYGTHLLTSQSRDSFKDIFGDRATDISYVTVTGQFAAKGKTDAINYIFLEWRALLSKQRYSAFTNNAIITLGVRKTLELGSGIFQANNKGKGTRRNVIHPTF
jgi:hypothetical protein